MKKKLYNTSKAFKHVLGVNYTTVILIIICIGWLTDMVLELLIVGVECLANSCGVEIPTPWIAAPIVVLMIAILWFLGSKAQKTTPSDRFVANGTDKHREKREVLVMALSSYQPRRIEKKDSIYLCSTENDKGYSLEELEKNLANLNSSLPIQALRYTDFQCNWLPALQAISHYKNIKKVVVLSSAGPLGSFKQIDAFEKFINQYFGPLRDEITVKKCTDELYMTDSDMRAKCQEGIPDKFLYFSEVVLHVVDNIAASIDGDYGAAFQRIAIDITGGKSSMTASMAAASVNRDIYLHYTDTNSMQSQELDITAK